MFKAFMHNNLAISLRVRKWATSCSYQLPPGFVDRERG